MNKIVTMPRWYGDVLTRMKIEYVNTGIKNRTESTILVPDKQARFFKRFGQEFDVRDNYAPQDVFGEDFDISLVLAENLPEGFENREETVKNQNEATIDKVSDNLYLIEADFTDMVKYTSTDPNQAALGEFYWLGVVIDTGEESIIGSKFNGYTFVQADVDEATSVGAPAGSFILWLKLECGNRTFILKSGDKETAITLKIVNTAVEDVVAPYVVSATAYFEDGDPVDFVGNTITVESGSTVTFVEATLNSSVVLNGTPEVTITMEHLETPYGSIEVDDEDSKVVIITPYGSNGTSSIAGEFVVHVPADSVRHRGVGNEVVTINLIVVEAEPSEE